MSSEQQPMQVDQNFKFLPVKWIYYPFFDFCFENFDELQIGHIGQEMAGTALIEEF